MTVIRREDGREWRIEDSDVEGIQLVFGDDKYPHDPPRVASRLESALASQLQGAVRLSDEEWERVLWWLHKPVPPGPAKALDETIIRQINAQRG